VKWAGGKRQLLGEILSRLPGDRFFGTYHEPFLGGGAVFFGLRPGRAVLSDSNDRLIRTYRAVRDNVDAVVARLQACRNDLAFFTRMKAMVPDGLPDAELAGWFIYLNKTGFNGLYRVNRDNVFNISFADNGARICDEDGLRACSRALALAELRCEDFTSVLDRAQPGDIVYFDPPYVPVTRTASFTSYTAAGFGPGDHARLRDVALQLKRKRVCVLVSISSAALVSRLYAEDFECIPVSAARAINSNGSGRGRVKELLLR
jgi:DNA adenine methylase